MKSPQDYLAAARTSHCRPPSDTAALAAIAAAQADLHRYYGLLLRALRNSRK